ncbi:MAG TPA: alkaline phosphatase family protein [Candidatus Tumulicola sp.]
MNRHPGALAGLALVLAACASPPPAVTLPTGQRITPLAAPGSTATRLVTGLRADGSADAGGAISVALAPDARTLLLLTSGYDYQYFTPAGRPIRFPVPDPRTGRPTGATTAGTQWVFVYQVGEGLPRLAQRIAIPNAFYGLAWSPDGRRFYVSGGTDDRVLVYERGRGGFVLDPPEIALGHDGGILARTAAGRRGKLLGLDFGALAAGLAVSADGRTLAIANMQNDSLSLVDLRARRVVRQVRFARPGGRIAQGEYPFGVAILPARDGSLQKAYASALRDGDVAVVRPAGSVTYVRVGGEPNALQLDPPHARLYVANGDLDEIDEIDTQRDRLVRRIGLDRPADPLRGANPNALALGARGDTLLVSLGGENAVAIVDLKSGSVIGRIPTGWYPTALVRRANALFVADAKSPSGPNPNFDAVVGYVGSPAGNPRHIDEYVLDLEKADLLQIPLPSSGGLSRLSAIEDANNGFGMRGPNPDMAFLRSRIRHVILVMKENRTYDQVLGDLHNGSDGDPRLTSFPYAVAPNHHELAEQFVTLDRFFASGDVSADGWNWTLQGRANEYTMRAAPISYASDAFSFDWNGLNRGLNLALPARGGSRDPFHARATTLLDPSGDSTTLPGSKDIAATGYLWDAVLRAGKSVRQYGLYTDPSFYAIGAPHYIPIVRHAYAAHAPQAPSSRQSLAPFTDVYYRGWDLNTPDRFRYEEWKREFDGYVRRGDLPAFEAVCLMMDHFGQFATNAGGLNTPYLQMADDDYALGLLVQAVSHSPYWKDTAIFVVEDDAQDGPDHVDSHRSPAFAISAYTRRGAVVHTPYTTMSVLRTIEAFLDVPPLGMYDANAPAMDDVFTREPDVARGYTAVLPGNLCRRPVRRDLAPECAHGRHTAIREPLRGAAWWIAQTRGFNFNRPDAIDPRRFNALLQTGLLNPR